MRPVAIPKDKGRWSGPMADTTQDSLEWQKLVASKLMKMLLMIHQELSEWIYTAVPEWRKVAFDGRVLDGR